MNKYTKAADALAREAARTKVLIEAAAALAELGSLENAKSELEAAINTKRAEGDALDAQIGTMREVSLTKLAEADERAANMLRSAEATAANIRKLAEQDAEQRVDAAGRSAEFEIAKRDDAIAAASAAKAERDGLDHLIAERRTELARIEAELADVRARLGVK
jgi:hypothetical protein